MQWWLILEVRDILKINMCILQQYFFVDHISKEHVKALEQTSVYSQLSNCYSPVNGFIVSHVLHSESRFLQSVDEDNMTKQPGVSAVACLLDESS